MIELLCYIAYGINSEIFRLPPLLILGGNMKKRIISALLCVMLVFSLYIPSVASGSSAQTVPSGYTPIYTRADLVNVKNNLSGKYILMNDIDLRGTYYGTWVPIGTSGNAFTGTFDGNGHVVRGLYINTSANYQGLFGMNCGVIKNLTVQGSVSGGEYVGGIAGASYKSTNSTAEIVLSNLRNECTVTGTGNYVGGIVGCAKVVTESGDVKSTVSNCTNAGKVKGYEKYTGGIAGANISYVSSVTSKDARAAAYITNCANAENVNGVMVVGGICGTNQAETAKSNAKASAASKISLCSNTASVTASEAAAGGICGVNDTTTFNKAEATVDFCGNTGTVVCSGIDAGGVVSRNQSETSTTAAVAKSTVSNTYNRGTVKAGRYIGGIVAYNCANSLYGSCYSTVSKSYSSGYLGSGESVGGAVGYTYTGANVTFSSGSYKVSKTECTGCYYLNGTAPTGIGHGSGSVSSISGSTLASLASSLGTGWKQGSNYPEIIDLPWTNSYATISGNISIKGTVGIGKTLTLDTGDIYPAGATYSAKWYKNGTAVKTGLSYDFAESDYNCEIYCIVYSTGSYNGTLRTVSIFPKRKKLTGTLGFSERVEYDRTVGAVLPDKNATVRYEWSADSEKLSSEPTLYLQKEHIGKTLTLTVTGYGDYEGSLAASAVIEKRTVGGKVKTVFDSSKYGETLSMDYSGVEFINDGLYDYELNWLCDDEVYKNGESVILPEDAVGKVFKAQLVILDADPYYRGTVSGEEITCSGWANPFLDVKTGQWYETSVRFAYENGLFSGIEKHIFSPNTKATRAMFVTVLSRLYGNKTDNNVTSAFTDVESGAWYAGAVEWASRAGITSGTSATTFSPDMPITREQMCAMLKRYADYVRADLVPETSAIPFADQNDISAYAVKAVTLMHDCGIISGKTATEFLPGDSATRAEVSSVLRRFCAYMNK